LRLSAATGREVARSRAVRVGRSILVFLVMRILKK
jgi:hypothetical protein